MSILFSPASRQDLVDIWDYIARDSVDAADRVLHRISLALMKLAEMPGIGHTRTDVKDTRIRFWSVYSYLIVYRSEADNLMVLRIVHGSRDLRSLLRS
jgi:antitoxin ParD1/3/4/toxin ParE1/3/4